MFGGGGGGGLFNDGYALGKYSANFSKNAPKHLKYRKKNQKKNKIQFQGSMKSSEMTEKN